VLAARAQTASADSLFVHGDFTAARAAYVARLETAPTDRRAARRVALLDLWANHLADVVARLAPLVAADSTDHEAATTLIEAYARQRRFVDASRVARRLGDVGEAEQLASLPHPYLVSIPRDGTRLVSEPGTALPVFHVRVNGRDALMILDTGGGELILDPAFADSVGARRFAGDSGVYAGGKRASFDRGAVDSVQLRDAVVRNLPVHIQSTSRYAGVAGGHAVQGIIGTTLLAQFRATLDFSNNALRLDPRSSPTRGGTPLPFWLLGDHMITTPAVAMGHLRTLLVFDTGLALPDGALVPSATLIARAGITLPHKTVTGEGGGGTVTATPFTFPALDVGPFRDTALVAIAGIFPPTLERSMGPEIGGLVSHGFFSGHRVTLDFNAMQLVVDATPWVAHREP